MPKEIERKFILKDDRAMHGIAEVINMEQGYIAEADNCVVRVRTSIVENLCARGPISYTAKLTLKSRNAGISRDEFEYDIPMEHANALMASTDLIVKKSRFIYLIDGHKFECDTFASDLEGLELAEVEFNTIEEANAFDPSLYPFLGDEVSEDKRYSNHHLAGLSRKELKAFHKIQ